MSQLVVRGRVTTNGPNQLNVRVQNKEETRRFWEVERIDTHLDWAGVVSPLVSMGKQNLINQCKPGDLIDYTIETWDRADGRRIRGVAVRIIGSE